MQLPKPEEPTSRVVSEGQGRTVGAHRCAPAALLIPYMGPKSRAHSGTPLQFVPCPHALRVNYRTHTIAANTDTNNSSAKCSLACTSCSASGMRRWKMY